MKEVLDIKSMPTVQIIQALGKRFREYRIAARMTQKEVAEQSGVSLLTIRRFEQGYSYDIKLGNLIALLKAKGASHRQLERLTGVGRGLIQKL